MWCMREHLRVIGDGEEAAEGYTGWLVGGGGCGQETGHYSVDGVDSSALVVDVIAGVSLRCGWEPPLKRYLVCESIGVAVAGYRMK